MASWPYLHTELWLVFVLTSVSMLNCECSCLCCKFLAFYSRLYTEQWLFSESDVPTEDVIVILAYELVIFLISAIGQINNQEVNTDYCNFHILDTIWLVKIVPDAKLRSWRVFVFQAWMHSIHSYCMEKATSALSILPLWSVKERKSYWFATTWVNNNRMLYFFEKLFLI